MTAEKARWVGQGGVDSEELICGLRGARARSEREVEKGSGCEIHEEHCISRGVIASDCFITFAWDCCFYNS